MDKPDDAGILLAEGKTKRIWESERHPLDQVIIESKDDITAGDGEKHEQLAGKAALSTKTTTNCFRLIESRGIDTHYLGPISDTTFSARHVAMIPIEIVVRRIATGSYLKRHPNVKEGNRFPEPVVEFFLKDNDLHDPLMIYDFVSERVLLCHAKKPLAQVIELREMNEVFKLQDEDNVFELYENIEELKDIGKKVFEILERAWDKIGVTLVDLKIECGHVGYQAIVADVIDNDSWRLWPAGDKDKQLDKQVFREGDEKDPELMAQLVKNYEWVANATDRFFEK